MKLALVNPNTSAEVTAKMVAIATETASAQATIVGHTAGFGAALITEPDGLAIAAKAVAALRPSLDDADAVIVAAFGDPGLDELRATLSVPATGIAEAGMAEAAEGGRRFAVVTTTPDLRQPIADTAARYKHRNFAGTWTTPGDPATLTADRPALEAALAASVEQAIRDAGVEAVIIGGGPLAVAARALAAQVRVPLIEPVPAAVRLSLQRVEA